MREETEETLQQFAENARLVGNTVKTPGWTDVIRPALINQRDSLLEQLLTEVEHRNMILIQQSALAINNLLTSIEGVLADGQAATVEYRRRKGLSEHP